MKKFLCVLSLVMAVFGLTMVWGAPNALAQSPYGLSAQVDATEITTDDTVSFSLTLTTPDGSGPRLSLPTIDGFNVVSSQTVSQFGTVNGNSTASMRNVYALQPTRRGDITIPTLHLDYNGQTLATEPITIHVSQGNGTPTKKQPSSNSPFGPGGFGRMFGGNDPFNDPFFGDPFGPDMFSNSGNLNLQAATDKKSVYVGEPLQYKVRVTSDAMLMGEPEYDAPKFTGFWVHQPPDTMQGANESEMTMLLFPTKAGTLTIDPATIRAGGGFFSDPLERKTDPVTVEVKPLPQGAPAGFNGAVGTFNVTATPDKTDTRVGEPITVKVQVRGAGNFDTMTDLKWQNLADWRAFDAKADTQAQVQNGKLVGTKTYTRTLIPTKEGRLTIPAMTFAYFDPADAQYHTVGTQAIEVNVGPGDPNVAQNVASLGTTGNTAQSAPANGAKGPALAPMSGELASAAKPLAQQPLFWGLFMIPLGIVSFDIGLALRKRYLDANAAERRASRALLNARRSLKRARKSSNVSLEVAKIVLQYLEDKANRSLLGVPHSAIAQVLAAQGITHDLIQDTMVLLLAGESSEYGKMYATTPEQTLVDAGLVLNALEGEWRE